MEQKEILDRFEKTLEDGLVKICRGAGILDEMVTSPDIDGKWDEYIKSYIEDAVSNFNEYPEAALAWAAFLGMGVSNRWDSDWKKYSGAGYRSYYGSKGWDDMDEHVMYDILHLVPEHAKKVSETLDSCALATLGLIRHEGIETQTQLGFFILARAYSVMFRIGEAIELKRLGYRKVLLDPTKIINS